MSAHGKIGALRASFIVAGNMIGSGVYLLPQTLGAKGSSSMIGWLFAAGGALLLAFVFAMLFRLRPEREGMVRQVSGALGSFFGFQASFLYWLSGWIGNGAIAVTATSYLSVFFPVLREPVAGLACTLALVWFFTGLCFFGVRRVAEFGGVSLALGLLPVLGAAVLGWFAFDPELFRASWNPGGTPLTQSIPPTVIAIFWAFLGLESAAVVGALVRNPRRDVPIATLGGVALTAALYVAAAAAMFGLLPAAELAASSAPFADVAARWMGAGAAALVAACAVLKTAGTLSGWILCTAEASRSAADAGVFPRLLKEPADAAPRRNLLLTAALMTATLLLSASPVVGEQFRSLISLATLVFMVLYLLCAAALLRETRDWGVRAGAVLAGAFCVWAFVSASVGEMAFAAGLSLLAMALYPLARRAV
ncbi:MAG: amino acid permease [Vitreimonas sp.]